MDKIKHCLISFVLFILLVNVVGSPHTAAVITFAIGLIKELYDKVTGKGPLDIKDILANLLGIFFGYLVFYIIIFYALHKLN